MAGAEVVGDRARIEARVMAEMAGLAALEQSYPDLVHRILDLVEHVVSSPFLSLTVREGAHQGLYVRAAGADPFWVDEAERHVEGLYQRGMPAQAAWSHQLAAPPAWFISFFAEARSGRIAALTLGAPEPLVIQPDEEEMMLRLARQALLVLDNALLLEAMESLELTDPLTGIANYRRLMDILEYELRQHRYLRSPLTLMILDVEGLGAINRSYGNQYGSHILRRIAQMLQDMVRPIDLVARCGLDEFAVVLPETNEGDGQRTLERLRDEIGVVQSAGGNVEVTVGMACVGPDERLSAETFIRRGERALHQAKRQERSLVPARRG